MLQLFANVKGKTRLKNTLQVNSPLGSSAQGTDFAALERRHRKEPLTEVSGRVNRFLDVYASAAHPDRFPR
jgi:hypothetical protein